MRYIPATAPATAANLNASRGTAVSTDGQMVSGVTQVINTIEGTKELAITLTNTTANPVRNIVLFPGVQSDAAASALPAGVTFESDFNSRDAFLSYFAHIATTVQGLRLETNKTDNIVYQNLLFSEKDPTGEENKVKFSIGKFKYDLGGGEYAKQADLSPQNLTFIIWAALRVMLDRIEANSSITIYFKVAGWNKAQGMSSLNAAIL